MQLTTERENRVKELLESSVDKYTDETTVGLANILIDNCKKIVMWGLIKKHNENRELIEQDMDRFEDFITLCSSILAIQMVELGDGVMKGPMVQLFEEINRPELNTVEPKDIQ